MPKRARASPPTSRTWKTPALHRIRQDPPGAVASGRQDCRRFAAAAAGDKLDVKTYANFTLRQPPEDLPYQALSALQKLETGQVTEMSASAEKGYLVFAQEKKLPDLTPGNPRFVEMQKQLMLFTAGTNQNSYLVEMVERELKKSTPQDTP